MSTMQCPQCLEVVENPDETRYCNECEDQTYLELERKIEKDITENHLTN